MKCYTTHIVSELLVECIRFQSSSNVRGCKACVCTWADCRRYCSCPVLSDASYWCFEDLLWFQYIASPGTPTILCIIRRTIWNELGHELLRMCVNLNSLGSSSSCLYSAREHWESTKCCRLVQSLQLFPLVAHSSSLPVGLSIFQWSYLQFFSPTWLA